MSYTAAWKALAAELRAHDQWGHFTKAYSWPGTLVHPQAAAEPVNILINGGVPVLPYKDILLRSLDTAMTPSELDLVVRTLTQKGMVEATERLLKFFTPGGEDQDQNLLWTVGNALYHIAPRDHLDEVVAICRNRRFGYARRELVLHLSRFKKNEEVFQTLLSLLDDDSVRGVVLEALWRFGDVRAIPAIEATPVREGFYEAKSKSTALRRLDRKKDRAG